MILRIGSGSLRTRVGMATIWSPLASCGVSSRSMISMEYFPSHTLGGEIGSDIGVFPETFTGADATPRHTDVVHRAALDWHHDWSEAWSHTVAAGALVVYETDGVSPVVNPAGSASINYASERGTAALSYAHAAQPNVVQQQMTLADTITLSGVRPHFAASRSMISTG